MSAPKKRCPGCAELATECACDFAEGPSGPPIPEGSAALLQAPLDSEPPGSPAFQAPEQWTPEQVEKFKAEWDRLTGDPKGLRHLVRPLPPPGLNDQAAAFASAHGSFSLHFDASQNYVRPDDAPGSLELHGRTPEWGGFTAEEAIAFAATDLGTGERDGGI